MIKLEDLSPAEIVDLYETMLRRAHEITDPDHLQTRNHGITKIREYIIEQMCRLDALSR